MEDYGAGVNDWVNVVRRARLAPTTKLVALTLASYADPDGTKVFPGVARLVVQCRIRFSTARAGLADLRHAGLIERVRRGNRRRGQSDEYRLILAADLLERVDVPTPDEERAEIEQVKERNVSATRARQRALHLRRQAGVNEPNASGNVLRQPGGVNEPIYATETATFTPPRDPPPSIGPLQERNPPSPANPSKSSLRPQRAREANDELDLDEKFSEQETTYAAAVERECPVCRRPWPRHSNPPTDGLCRDCRKLSRAETAAARGIPEAWV